MGGRKVKIGVGNTMSKERRETMEYMRMYPWIPIAYRVWNIWYLPGGNRVLNFRHGIGIPVGSTWYRYSYTNSTWYRNIMSKDVPVPIAYRVWNIWYLFPHRHLHIPSRHQILTHSHIRSLLHIITRRHHHPFVTITSPSRTACGISGNCFRNGAVGIDVLNLLLGFGV